MRHAPKRFFITLKRENIYIKNVYFSYCWLKYFEDLPQRIKQTEASRRNKVSPYRNEVEVFNLVDIFLLIFNNGKGFLERRSRKKRGGGRPQIRISTLFP